MKRYGASLLLLILIHIVSFTAQARDFYWIGGTGNFNDIKHWSDQPGGKVNPWALLPDKDDNVYFDEYSFPDAGASVTITSVARCANMHWGNVKNMPTLTSDDNNAHYLVVYGGLTFNNKMILDLDRPLYFRASTEGNEIDFGGNVFDGDLIFENNGGWRIISDLDLINNDIYFNQGSLSIEGTVNCGRFISENSVSRELYLNSSNINLSDSGSPVISILTDNLLVDAGDSKINILSNNSSIETSGLKNIEFYDVVFEGNSGIVATSGPLASFNSLTFKQDGSLKGQNDFQELLFTQGFSYFIDSDGIQKVNSKFTAKGTCYAFITINGASSGGFISAETVDLEYLKVNNITASGSAVNFDAKTSYDLGGNSGWSFGAPSSDDYTWTGAGTDNNWSNYLNWDKGCVPSRNNNAIIGAGYTVEIDQPAECKSLTVDDAAILDGSGTLEIYASLTATNATWNYDGETYFKGANLGNTISINANIAGSVFIEGTGDWTLNTVLNIANDLYLNSGTLNTNGNDVSINRFVSNSSAIRAFDISNSNVQINQGSLKAWHVQGGGFSIDHVNSTTFLVGGAEFYNNSSDGVSYGKVVFDNSLGDLVYLTNEDPVVSPIFEELIFNGRANISGNHQFTKIVFSKGNEYKFQAGSTQKILSADGLIAEGTCSDYISFKGDGGIAFINSDASSSRIVRIRVEDVNVKGGVLTSAEGGLVASQSIAVSGYDGWVFPDDLTGADIYWTGKIDDNWFEAENWEGDCIPTRKDNVFFNDSKVVIGGSSEVNISQKGSIAECKKMTWENASGMTFSGDQPINIFGSLDMSGMIAGSNSYSGAINFEAEEAATIKIGDIQLLSDLNFIGNQQEDGTWLAGPWSIISELVTTGDLDLKHGALTTNGNNIEVSEFYSNYADQSRSLNLGSSILRVDRMEISADEFIFDAGTSEIQFAEAQDLIISKGDETLTFNNITFEESEGNAYVDITADNVSFNNMVFAGNTYFRKRNDSKISFTAENIQMAVGKTYVFEAAQTYILGGLIANGACEGTIDITGSDSDAAIFQAKTGVSNIEVNSVNLLNIYAEPDDVFVAKKSLDLGNTDGWKFEDEPVGDDLFWVGGTGNWDDPDHWSTTSGGSPDGCVPTAKDNVYFDANSFPIFDPVVYTGAGDIRCRTMDWTGSEASRPNFEMGDTDISGVYIYGSFILNSSLTIDLSPFVDFYFRATEAQDINPFAYVFPNNVEFDGKGGVWTMQDSLVVESDILIQYGNLNVNGNYIESRSIVSSEPTDDADSRGLNIENSECVITGIDDEFDSSIYLNLSDNYGKFQTFNLLADGSTIRLEGDDAKIVLSGTSANAISFNEVIFEQTGWLNSGFSGMDVYASHLLFQENGNISGKNNRFGKLELSRGFEFQFEDGRTIEMDSLLVEGSCFAPIYLHSNDDGKETYIKSANNVNGDFLELKDIHALDHTTITYTATNSQDLGNVVGWNIDEVIAPISLYWTGNGADDSWHNHENWSRAADGSEEGCVPTINDDVFFTANSFLGSKLVEVLSDAECHNMTWEDDIDPAANFSVNEKIQIGGFMDLAESMKLDMKGTLEFVGDGISGDKSVDFADKSMDGDIIFNGDAQSWIWESGFTSSGNLNIEAGSVSTNEYDFSVGKFNSTSTLYRYFNMTGSRVSITSSEEKCWNMLMNTPLGMDFIATDTRLDFINGGELFCTTDGDVTFGFVDFYDNGIININSDSDLEHGHFGAVKFHEQGQVFGTNDFTNLEFTLGYEGNTIESGKTIIVEHDLTMEGVRCSYVFLKASNPGDIAYIHKPTGIFEKIYNASLKNIQGSTGSGAIDHPVKYHFDSSNTTGFKLFTEDADGDGEDDENPPAFEETFDKEEWCSNIAQIDNVEGFPINSATTFQWYFSDDDGVTYEKLDGETNAVIEVTESGFYKVEVIYDVNSGSDAECRIESIVEVVLGTPSTISLEITSNNVKCFGQEDGIVVAKVKDNATGNYPDFTFFWEDEDGNIPDKITTDTDNWTSKALDLAPGKYYVKVADVKKCEFDTIVNIFDAYELLIDKIDTTSLTCYTVPSGEINIEASGGTGNLSYYLDEELQADENIGGLFSGDYKVYVQDENNCTSDTLDVSIDSKPKMELSLSGSNILCFGDTNGEINPVVSGGVPEYSYAWTGPGGFSSTGSNLTGLSGGLYELTVTDKLGCTTLGEQEIEEPLELIASELVVEPANCHGESTGEIFVVGGQGTQPYRYLLDGEEDSTGIFDSLAPENYALRIIDAHGCIYDKDIEVSEPNEVGFLVDDKVLPSCEQNEDGIIHITPYGGNEGYSFAWTGPKDYKSYQQNIENLIAGKYALQITDKKNCTSIDSVDLNLGLTLQVGLVVEQHVKVAGGNDGILAIELIEGKPPYTYTLNGPSGVVSSPDLVEDNYYLIENLSAGVYTIIATDISGCATVEKSVIIEEPNSLDVYIKQIMPVGCVDASDGELKAIVAGGSGTYTYSWTGPDGYSGSGESISGLSAGTYSVTVISDGNSASASFDLLPADPIIVSVNSVKNVSCYQAADGEIELSVDVGDVDYTIEWTSDNGFLSSAKHVLDLEPGTYNYVVSTVAGCSVSGSQDITEPLPLNLTVTPTDISVEGERDGELGASFGNGTSPYTVMVSGPNGYSFSDEGNTSGSISIDGLEMGIYEVVVIDANGCRIEDAKKVHEPLKLLVYTTSITHVTCPGGNDGAISIGIDDESDPANLSFSWEADNYFRSNNKDISDLEAGTYRLTVYDSGGDPGYEEQTIIVIVEEPDVLSIDYNTENISCSEMTDGYINIQAQGGTPGYTFSWTGTGVEPNNEDQNNLVPGIYTVHITDVNGCVSEPIDIEITEPPELNVTPTGMGEPTCYGDEDGWIQLDISNGTEPYIVEWDNYGSVTQRIEGLEDGIYHYKVIDANGCVKSNEVELTEPDSLIAEILDYEDVECAGESSGRAYVDISGGTADYEILWSDGHDGQELSNMFAGRYEVKVTDSHGCKDTSSVEIFEPDPLNLGVEAIRPTTYESMDGGLSVKVDGGVPDYVINWVDQDLNFYNGDKLEDLERGVYELTITDKNNCVLDSTITLEYLFERRIKIPKAFTPNADGYNDNWDIERIEFIQDLKIIIYDRWGKAVYVFSGTGNEYKGEPWTGVDGSQKLPIGSYYYAVTADEEKPIIGTVTILR